MKKLLKKGGKRDEIKTLKNFDGQKKIKVISTRLNKNHNSSTIIDVDSHINGNSRITLPRSRTLKI